MIRTSRPYALCHQLSNGADVSIAPQPQMQIHAPSGARNPQKLHGRAPLGVGPAERRVQRDVAGADAGDQTARLDQQMRRRPERVAADRHVPGDVPVHADHHARRGEHRGVCMPARVASLDGCSTVATVGPGGRRLPW